MDAFYISIGNNDVPLSYFDEDPAKLKAVKKFPPFATWASSFQAHPEFSITKVDIQNIDWVGKRINGVKASVELTSSTGQKTVQSVATSEVAAETAVVLPVTAEGHVLLNKYMSLATLGKPTLQALYGTVSASGEVSLDNATALESLGLTVSADSLTPLSDKFFSCSTDGSTEKIKLYRWAIPHPSGSPLPLKHGDGELVLIDAGTLEDKMSTIMDTNSVLVLALHQTK
uniref:Uncharacterized protein n=1 Tax=Eutreptiella gymnastica TaxID=73025 RepID=A0A7S1N3P7_9EUGL|mmetsp:Transcript_115691/g.201362  ORF Transcript_115691/g.201362 Transcript_115691/m.201362 type:complete len:229 (+) Transcript_115691:121-807(+)